MENNEEKQIANNEETIEVNNDKVEEFFYEHDKLS